MKYIFLACLCIFVSSCDHSGNNPGQDHAVSQDSSPHGSTYDSGSFGEIKPQAKDDFLIIPGGRLGRTALGITADSLEKLLGKPDAADAAMGKAWLTWNGKPDEHNNRTRLDIYTTYKDSTMMEKTVQQIHTTSSHFHTADNLHVYSSMRDVHKIFPKLEKAAHYTSEGRDIFIWDEQSKGIAFEEVTANNEDICIGIIVHKSRLPVVQTYIYLQPEVKLIR